MRRRPATVLLLVVAMFATACASGAEDAVEEFATIHDPALRRTVESNLLET